jgi:MoaA/NifB/PqqE/SkfB family radical SAM enzyme
MDSANVVRLGPGNFDLFCGRAAASYEIIRFDSNNDCNVHCVYCHNRRSSELVELEAFRAFMNAKVIALEQFQLGCAMEPTLDKRMVEFMEAVAASPARPRRGIRLQTNGILLHRHDSGRMAAAGLAFLTVSVDSITGDTHKDLRGGTSLAKVQRNIIEFRRACPDIAVGLLTTVTTENIDDVDELLRWGLSEGVAAFELRQIFHHPGSEIVDHERMRRLLVTAEAFAAMRARIQSLAGDRARILFLENDEISRIARDITLRSQPARVE